MPSHQVAFFKMRPSRTIPCRPGPIQCIRNCPNCVLRSEENFDAEQESLIAIKSYDDLVIRKSMWHSLYRSILYHPGQIDVIRNALKQVTNPKIIYIVASGQIDDLQYLRMILEFNNMDHKMKLLDRTTIGELDITRATSQGFIVPLGLPSCPINDPTKKSGLLALGDLVAMLESIFEGQREGLSVCPVAISKDKDPQSGVMSLVKPRSSICIQMQEPYILSDYIKHLFHVSEPGKHLAQHLHHDLARGAARHPSHLVAFILLYLNRDECGVTHEDLVDYVDWMRKSAMECDLQVIFSGPSEHVVQSAIDNLYQYIHADPKHKIYRPINLDALAKFADVLAPNFLCYGIISRSILMIHNGDSSKPLCSWFDANVPVRVMKDDVIDCSVRLAEKVDHLVPFRRPCVTLSTVIIETFNKMQTFGNYFKVEEPKVRRHTGKAWCGDDESDDEYYWSKRDDPAFKSWLVLTQRPYRLDRLNLFINSIDAYLS